MPAASAVSTSPVPFTTSTSRPSIDTFTSSVTARPFQRCPTSVGHLTTGGARPREESD